MEHIGNLLATITSVRAEERLRAIAQLDLAIAIFLSDIESAAEVAVLIAMIEQVITSIAATGQGLALNNVRDIATLDIAEHACAYNDFCTSNWAHSEMPIGASTHIVNCFVDTLQSIIVEAAVSCAPLVFLPTHGGCDGDNWVREIAFNCRLAFKGARDIADSIAAYYWVLVLPDTW
ncbi:ABCB10, partial [Symbiodinium sp. KB8]